MARRMEVELTSNRDDGTWTWRAAGAKEPRGVVPEQVLPSGSSVGDVLRVEADFELDGITITSVLPPKQKPERAGMIEIASRPAVGAVTTSLVGRGARGSRPAGDRDRGRSDATGRPAAGSRREGPRRDGARPDGTRPERHGAAGPIGRDTDRRPGPARGRPRSAGARDDASRASRTPAAGTPTGMRPPAAEAAGARHAKARPQRLVPGTAHRSAYLETLPPEQRPVAEQLAAGGLPAVRRALDEARAAARAEGRAHEPGDAILGLAEQLLPGVREAVWLDRAEATVARIDTVSLRDLRTAVVGGAPRDESGRALLQRLREALDERVTKLRSTWEADVVRALDEGRILQALRLSSRPPEPTARFPAALVTRLAESAGSAMTAATPPERWLAILEAAVSSPIRRSIKPEGMPEDPAGAVRRAAQAEAGRIPALARLLGLTMPPPPRPLPPPPARAAVPARHAPPATGPSGGSPSTWVELDTGPAEATHEPETAAVDVAPEPEPETAAVDVAPEPEPEPETAPVDVGPEPETAAPPADAPAASDDRESAGPGEARAATDA